MHRRAFLTLAAAAVAAPLAAGSAEAADAIPLTVVKSPTCGCCGAWVEHMEAAGFRAEVHDVSPAQLDAFKREAGLQPEHASCHTAIVAGYVVEGHVPASDVKRLLAERPDGLGLAVPGMPVGSPGMEMGDRRDSYDTLLVKSDGGAEVFARHR